MRAMSEGSQVQRYGLKMKRYVGFKEKPAVLILQLNVVVHSAYYQEFSKR